MIFGFDIISDLHLSSADDFNLEGKQTSLFCIVAGNISRDLRVILKVLRHLSTCYQGVFYIDGSVENGDINFRESKVKELSKICSVVPNAVYLHNNVVVVDGIALVGLNGWYANHELNSDDEKFQARCNRYEDIVYLERTLEKLQLHVDVKKIIIISNSVPAKQFFYGESKLEDDLEPMSVLDTDTEHKIKYWVFGSHKKIVDTYINGINYLNNPKYDRVPYYPKRIELTL
jgi:predicted phosphohydrolase